MRGKRRTAPGNHPAAAAAPLHRGDRGLDGDTGLGLLRTARNDGGGRV
ncbi:MAG: hypothetical protein LBM98_06985 [Oscillospiraceae bacterium]|nr:hypothetical protein [Oscillospiraceae bacterium]